MTASDSLVIVGAGHAGVQLAASARESGWLGTIDLVEADPVLPYQRPPLSKEFLAGGAEARDIVQRSDAYFDAHSIRLRQQAPAVRLDRAAGIVECADGLRLPFDVAVLASGSRARRAPIPGIDLAGVCELRTLSDATHLREAAINARDVVVVGAGFVGMETASALRSGRRVTVVEVAARVMPRVLSEPLSRYIFELHREHGVDVRLGVGVEAIVGEGRVEAVRLSDGTVVPADLVIVGIGAVPADELARDSGLSCENGVIVDGHLRTSDQRVFAIGDCANFPSPFAGSRMRLESLQNAVDQARFVGAGLTSGFDAEYDAVPWFWTHQFDNNVQIVGVGSEADEIVIGERNARGGFSVLRHRDGLVSAIESVNDPKTHMVGRRLFAGRPRQVAVSEVSDAFGLASTL